jgi:hypothetical protein
MYTFFFGRVYNNVFCGVHFKDYSTRSLDISEGRTNGHLDEDSKSSEDDIGRFQMRRRWETRQVVLPSHGKPKFYYSIFMLIECVQANSKMMLISLQEKYIICLEEMHASN